MPTPAQSADSSAPQIVNYNVRGRQYVVAGHVVALQALGRACDACKEAPEQTRDLDAVAATAVREATGAVPPGGATAIELRRGKATIPIPGVDVPFHSRLLRGGVPAFRACLRQQTDVEAMGAALPLMVHRYVPNLTARPFALTRDYACYVAELTDSPAILDICHSAEAWDAAAHDPLTTAHTILVELLAFQFASPVRWIETQDHLFSRGMARLIEVGPTPTLATMARRTCVPAARPARPTPHPFSRMVATQAAKRPVRTHPRPPHPLGRPRPGARILRARGRRPHCAGGRASTRRGRGRRC